MHIERTARCTVATGVVALVLACFAAPGLAQARPYLTTSKAKSVARSRAWNFDYRVEKVHVDWFSRWGSREVHVDATGSWTREIYHSGCADGYFPGCSELSWTEEQDSECDAIVAVKMNRHGYVWSHVSDKSCFYG